MKQIKGVQSTVKPNGITYDDNHVYVNSNIELIPEEERTAEKEQLKEGETLQPMYKFDVAEYTREEYITHSTENQSNLETSLLELSEVIYK